MKSATKKLTTEIAETLSGKIESIASGSKKIKKSIEKAAAKLAKKVTKFEKETLKAKAKEAKKEEKKAKSKEPKVSKKDKKKSEKDSKLAALVASASSKAPVATPAKVTVGRTGSKSAPAEVSITKPVRTVRTKPVTPSPASTESPAE